MALKLCHRIKISIKKTKTQNKPYSFSLLHIILQKKYQAAKLSVRRSCTDACLELEAVQSVLHMKPQTRTGQHS